jgi:hypothetical protein
MQTNTIKQALNDEIAALFEIGQSAETQGAGEVETPSRPSFVTLERVLTGLLALGILACLGGFFAFVPMLPVLTVGVLLSGLLAMFWIGFHLGGKAVRC